MAPEGSFGTRRASSDGLAQRLVLPIGDGEEQFATVALELRRADA